MKSSRAIYPGSFDPVHFGHLDVIIRSTQIFSSVIVAVAASKAKGPLFSVESRIQMLRDSIGDNPAVEIVPFSGLLVDFARQQEVFTVIRGLRAVSDFEFEFQMALMNRKLEPRLETVYLTPTEDYTYLSSRIVKEVALFGGDVSKFLPPPAEKLLKIALAEPSLLEQARLRRE
jgi:pantetheine-phosphate adenylyltransferase